MTGWEYTVDERTHDGSSSDDARLEVHLDILRSYLSCRDPREASRAEQRQKAGAYVNHGDRSLPLPLVLLVLTLLAYCSLSHSN